ncbi:unnamed protein product, partial [Staurois parvus]
SSGPGLGFAADTRRLLGKADRGETCVCCFVFLCIAEKYKAAGIHGKTAHIVKHTQFNPLIASDVKPFLPSVISTVSMLFISTDHCISVTGDVSGS